MIGRPFPDSGMAYFNLSAATYSVGDIPVSFLKSRLRWWV